VNRFCSIFSQLLKLFPRNEFEQLVHETRAERHARGFACWDQFVAMLFCQLGRAQSLREICGGLSSCEGKLVHLGVSAPSRSTLAYANAHRPWQLYEATFHRLLARCQELTAGGKRKFRFKNRLMSLDATVIDLCASVFAWAKYRRTKGAVKLHLLLDHDGYLPSVAVITEGKVADVRVARELRFEPGTILVVDRGYVDFSWFEQLTAQGVFFVTRPKVGMVYEVVEHLVPPIEKNIVADQIVELTSEQGQKIPWRFRRIEVYLPDKDETMALFTNHRDLSPVTIAGIYKERWQVELFFKALKQNLKIKTFVGTSANALRIQIWTALIAILLLRYLQLRSTFSWSLSNLVALLRMNLFVHRDLWSWINRPFAEPPEIPEPVQGELALAS
jgi:hypothetical protein